MPQDWLSMRGRYAPARARPTDRRTRELELVRLCFLALLKSAPIRVTVYKDSIGLASKSAYARGLIARGTVCPRWAHFKRGDIAGKI